MHGADASLVIGPLRSGRITARRKGGGTVSAGRGGGDRRNIARVRVRLESGPGAGRYVARWRLKDPRFADPFRRR